jgi:hypothetical protein
MLKGPTAGEDLKDIPTAYGSQREFRVLRPAGRVYIFVITRDLRPGFYVAPPELELYLAAVHRRPIGA